MGEATTPSSSPFHFSTALGLQSSPHAPESNAGGQLGVTHTLRWPERLALNHRFRDDASGHVAVPSDGNKKNE